MSTIMNVIFMTTAAILLSSSMARSAAIQELPFSSSSISSNKNLNSDLITEYILRDLLKSQSSIKNKQPQSQILSDLKPWFAQQAQQPQYQFQPEKNNEQQQLELLQEDPSLMSLLSDSFTPNANQQMMEMSDDFYYPPQQPLSFQQQPATLVGDGQRILGWFQDPIIDSRISPIAEIIEEGDNLDDIDGSDDESNGDESNSNNVNDVLLNALWARYLSGFNNQNEDNNNNNYEESLNGGGYDPQLFKDYEYKLNQMIEKRRQKIVKHNNGQASKNGESTTTTTTMRSVLPTSATSNSVQNSEKAKFLHKASNGAGNHLAKFGQKEYPMLRPASDRKNDEHDQLQNENQWPSELDDNTLADEDSLKSLKTGRNEMNHQNEQKRITRDALTSQLDNLKKEFISIKDKH